MTNGVLLFPDTLILKNVYYIDILTFHRLHVVICCLYLIPEQFICSPMTEVLFQSLKY